MKCFLRLRPISRYQNATIWHIKPRLRGQTSRHSSTSSAPRGSPVQRENALLHGSRGGVFIIFFTLLGIAGYAGMRIERATSTSQHDHLRAPTYATQAAMHTALGEIRAALLESRTKQRSDQTNASQPKNDDKSSTETFTDPKSEVEDMISIDDSDIDHHAFSEWSTSNSSNKPYAIIYPTTITDVSIIARICTKYKVPMVPYGAGSSVEGSFSAPHSGFTIDFSRMNRILAIHPDDMDVVVQPGVNWVSLNKTLSDQGTGLFLPLDPSPTALIGGMIATNCSGTNAMRYGTMKDWVVGLTIVTADGTVLTTRRRPKKSSAGYDLSRLFVGAEGTLGFVVECTLKLAVVPKETGVATCSFKDVKSASAAAVRMIREGMTGLAALEIMDERQMMVRNMVEGKNGRLWREEPTLFFKFSGADKESIEADTRRVEQIAKEFGGTQLEVARNDEEKDAIWKARKEALWAMLAQREEGTEIWSTDVAVPLSRLAEIIDISKKESSELGLFNSVLGHVGDGNFHQSVMYHPDDEVETARVAQCVEKMMDRALEQGGTISGEHAVGIGKIKSLEKEVGPEAIEMMRRLKLAVDPLWLMNPGKVFDHKASRVGH